MDWKKLTAYQESALFELLKHIEWLGHGPDTELVASPHEHLDSECYIDVVGKESYAAVPCQWHTLELLEDRGFVHQSSKAGTFRLRQDAWEYRDWQRLPRLRRWLRAQWAMAQNEIRSAVISAVTGAIAGLASSLVIHWLT